MPESIHWASAYGDEEYLKEILKARPDLVNKVNRHGMTPLHAATFHGNTGCVKILLKAGADPNIPSASDKFTFPLHLAVNRLHKEIVELLILQGQADVGLKDYLGRTALDIARTLCIENDSLMQDENLKVELIQLLQDCSTKVHAKSIKPFTFVSSHHKKQDSSLFFNETDLPSPQSHSNDFFKSETAIERI